MKTYKINEIFYSIQGEGFNTGRAAVFIRFAGCNLDCPFCDTEHGEYTDYSGQDILAAIDKYPCRNIILTGGEPMLQVDEDLIDELHKVGYHIAIETNGTFPISLPFDWITVSPKGAQKVAYADEIKILWDYIPTYKEESMFKHHFIQPIDNKNIKKIIKYIKANPKWRLSIQAQKILKIK